MDDNVYVCYYILHWGRRRFLSPKERYIVVVKSSFLFLSFKTVSSSGLHGIYFIRLDFSSGFFSTLYNFGTDSFLSLLGLVCMTRVSW